MTIDIWLSKYNIVLASIVRNDITKYVGAKRIDFFGAYEYTYIILCNRVHNGKTEQIRFSRDVSTQE